MRRRYLSWPRVAGLLTALSLALHANLISQFGSAIAGDLGDPILNTWILWWNTERVPLTDAWWSAPAFAPAPNTFALSETLLGLTWLTTPLQWMGATPLAAYNVMFVVVPVLNGLSAYWLCLLLTGRRDAALIGGLAFAFAPYRASQLSHLQAEATFFMPVTLVGLHQYWLTGGHRWVALFGAAMAMNGLVSGYFLLYFSLLVGLAVAWLMIALPDARKLAGVAASLTCVVLVLSPVFLKYRSVQRDWNLHRTITEVEHFSADLSSVALGSPHLALWPISTAPHRAELAGYPGLVIVLLIGAAAFVALRHRRSDLAAARWRQWLVRLLITLSAAVLAVGLAIFAMGGKTYKVFGIAIDLGIIAALLSARFWALLRSGSIAGLYATGFVTASLLALGPVGRVFGHRFWYRAPFAWLMQLPGFDAARVPARFVLIQIVCLAVVAAFAVVRIWPAVTRRSMLATAGIAIAIVFDGWARVPVVAVPGLLPVSVDADLVVELPMHGVFEDVAAMYRGITHGRPVVNGYSGWVPPHYLQLQADLRNDCVKSLESLRAGRSIDAVIWRRDPRAPLIDAAIKELWKGADRQETPEVILYHQPRTTVAVNPDLRCPAANGDRP